tara:strand:+ start:60196 stop:60852 length:657 start_codon:yes stop_codon:yes gene_type:complete
MTADDSFPEMRRPDRRSTERQISVLINAGIAYRDQDALCRIRNLSAGGVMIESPLDFAMDEPVLLQLRTGRTISGVVRWVSEGRAGIAFDDPQSAEWVTERLTAQNLDSSAIGYPLFRREASAKLVVPHRHGRARIAAVSPIGVVLAEAREWSAEQVFTIAIEGLGDNLARVNDSRPNNDEDELNMLFLQPLNYRALNDWLHSQPRIAGALLGMPAGR